MSAYWIWWIMAGVLVAAELVTGTFFLLALGVAFVVGGLVAAFGASFEIQMLVAAVVAIAGSFAAYRWRRAHTAAAQEPAFDIGQSVRVQVWNPDGTARVAYRGSNWTAELQAPDMPRGDTMFIVATRGSTLVIADRRP